MLGETKKVNRILRSIAELVERAKTKKNVSTNPSKSDRHSKEEQL